jgi:phosphatidylinositol alpha-1,6-mannosyltransferase
VRALWLAGRRRPRLVFCGHLYMAPLAFLLARLVGAKLIVQTHGIEVWDRPTTFRRAAIQRADLVLSVSRDTRGRVLDWVAGASERVVVLPNTVGEQFTPGDGGATRRRLGLQTQKLLLSVSRLDAGQRYKGHDRVIPLIGALTELGHDVVYLVGGIGDDRPRLEALARDQGVADRVRFLGAVPTNELVELYRAVDMYLMPSSGEGFGIVFLEAMACGAPAVGLAVGGARDALCDGELGQAVKEDELLSVIDASLRSERPDRWALSARVRERFGRRAFQARLAEVAEAFL